MSATHFLNGPGPLLPLDVIGIIGLHANRSDLLALLRTNRTLYRLLAPILYRSITVNFSRSFEDVQALLRLLLSDDADRPYARVCRSLTLDIPFYDPRRGRIFKDETQIAAVLSKMPNLRLYTDRTGLMGPTSPVWKVLAENKHSLVELNINFGYVMYTAPSADDPTFLFSLASSELRRLRLEFRGEERFDTHHWLFHLLTNAPNLEELFLGHCSYSTPGRFEDILVRSRLPNLKILHVAIESHAGEALTSFVRAHPKLVQLSLLPFNMNQLSATVSHLLPTDFPNLRRFSTEGDFLGNGSSVLSPSLTHLWNINGLRLEDVSEPPELAPNLYRDFTSLLHRTGSGTGLQFLSASVDLNPSVIALQRFVMECPNLRELWLYGNFITDAVVKQWWPALSHLRHLEALHLPKSIIHPEPDVLRLADACPLLRLIFDGKTFHFNSHRRPFEVWYVVREDSGRAVRLASLGHTRKLKPWEMPFLLESDDRRFAVGAREPGR